MEHWLPVVGYEGAYEVSDHGRVRSIDRVIETKRGPRTVRGRVLKFRHHKHGYPMVSPGFGKDALIHHWVLAAFVGPRPKGAVACHNDGNPANNTVSNLRYDTQSSNCFDTVRHGRNQQAQRTHCPKGHLFDEKNTYYRAGYGRRRTCRACDNERSNRRYHARRKLVAT